MEDNLYKKLPIELRQSEVMINSLDSDLIYLEQPSLLDAENFAIKIDGQHYDNKKDAGMALIDTSLRYKPSGDCVDIGEYNGFTLSLYKNFINETIVKLSREGRYNCEMSADPVGMITRLNNVVLSLPDRLQKEKRA